MRSDLPGSRALSLAPAISFGGTRTTRSPRASENRSSDPETCRPSSSAHTARCEYSDLLTDMGSAPAWPERAAEPIPPGSARAFVAADAEALLGRAAPSAGR